MTDKYNSAQYCMVKYSTGCRFTDLLLQLLNYKPTSYSNCNMKKFTGLAISLLLFTCVSGRLMAQDAKHDSLKSMSYIENKEIKVGVDLNLGGAITYVADAKKQENIINNSDWGRQIQMSFYSGPVPYEPGGKKASPNWIFIGWNPIQSGDVAGNRSKILAQTNDGKTIYVKCIPMHWPLNNVPGECYFESWIKLEGNTIQVRSRLVNQRNDSTQYQAREQELPAVYTNAPYHRLVSYRGEKPFTNDTTSLIANHNYPGTKNIQWAHWQATENWAANLDKNDYGLGIWNEAVQSFQGGYFGDNTFTGGSKSSATAYIAPGNVEVLDHNIVYDYHYTLILGTLKKIRGYVYQHSNSIKLPSFKFENSRMHWYYENTTDKGWPIKNNLVINVNKKAAIISPCMFWKAADAPVLTITAIFTGIATRSKVYWKGFNKDIDESNSLEFPVINDGKVHTYRVALNKSANYTGALEGLKILLDAAGTSKTGDMAYIRSISLTK